MPWTQALRGPWTHSALRRAAWGRARPLLGSRTRRCSPPLPTHVKLLQKGARQTPRRPGFPRKPGRQHRKRSMSDGGVHGQSKALPWANGWVCHIARWTPSRARRSLKKPPRPPLAPLAAAGTETVSAALAAAPPFRPDTLQAMAEDNTRLLSWIGWRKLAKKRWGRLALSGGVGTLPHEAAGYLHYLRRCGKKNP